MNPEIGSPPVSETPTARTIRDIVVSVDHGHDLVTNAEKQDGYDPSDIEDLKTLYLESIAKSLSALAMLTMRRDQEVWEEWKRW